MTAAEMWNGKKNCGTIKMELLDKHDDIDVFKRRWKEVEMREE